MFKRVLAICFFSCSLFAQGSFTFSENSNGSVIIFPISPSERGVDIIAHFNTLNSAPFKTDRSQIALQTTKNGLITNIQSITPTTHSTILLIAYLLPTNALPKGNVGKDESGTSFGYVAIPVEQTIELVFSPTTISATSVFTSSVPAGTLPIFSVDLSQRALDIEEAVNFLVTAPRANARSSISPVSIQTTLDGPFYTGGISSNSLIVNGLIPQVQNASSTVAPNGSLLLVTFKPPRPNQFTTREGFATVVVAPDQVVQIIFTQN